MRLCTKVIASTWQCPVIAQASTLAMGMHPGTVLLKFTTREDRKAVLQGHKGLARTKLGMDEDLTPAQ